MDNVSITASKLQRTSFRHTPLSSVSLASSDIEGIILSEDLSELRGARLDIAQALSVIRVLGVDLMA